VRLFRSIKAPYIKTAQKMSGFERVVKNGKRKKSLFSMA
jgi:hypothetical protein